MRFVPVVLVFAALGSLSTSLKPAPPFPYPWFIEHIQMGSLDLPSGVGVDLVPEDSPLFATESIVLKNTSPTILYVIGEHGLTATEYEDVPVKLLPGTGPVNKIVSGHAYRWQYTYDLDSTFPFRWFRWASEENHDQSDTVWLEANLYNRITSGGGTVVRLEPRNEYGGERPADVDVPDPQTAEILLVYGTELLKIPFTISYSINSDFRPSRPSPFPDHLTIPEALCLLLLAVMLGIGFLWAVARAIRELMKPKTRSQ